MSINFEGKSTGSGGPATANTVADPSTAAGQFLIAIWQTDGFETCTPPDGTWTQLFNGLLTSDNCRYYVWYKASSVGSGNYTFTSSSTDGTGLIVAAYSGVDTTTPLDGVTPVSTVQDDHRATPASIATASITTSSNNDFVIWLACADTSSNTPSGDSFTPPSGYTSRSAYYDTSGWNMLAIADKTLSTAGATGTVTGTVARAGSAFGTFACQIALKPAVAGGGGGSTIAFYWMSSFT